ncbi:Hypothetical protein CINCED_3A008659 [Cinara cedri]|uniref:Uncharacterized protein n=1 Tax=Cinara cedri TaxID=506608 RepID=A0A5E4MF34_9HEMI|nr:Hypothetical protein CINCED_3A008659 [Cinara cedri]
MKPVRKKTIRIPENIAAVRTALKKSPKRCARKHALSLNLFSRSLRRILYINLNFHLCKVQVVQELKSAALHSRTTFCLEMLIRMDENENFIQNVWMSDEAHFHLDGFVNNQNCRYWSEENPR